MVPPAMCDQATKPDAIWKCNPKHCHRSQTTSLPKHRLQSPNESKKNVRFRWKKTAWSPVSNPGRL